VPVSLTYKKEGQHKTMIGGVMSVFCSMIVAFYCFIQFYGLVMKPDTTLELNYKYDREVSKHWPILEAKNFELFPMIGIRSAAMNKELGVMYD